MTAKITGELSESEILKAENRLYKKLLQEAMTNPNDLAYPQDHHAGELHFVSPGLTKREYFAALAMQGLVASTSHDDAPSLATLAEWSVRQADALIEALNKPVP